MKKLLTLILTLSLACQTMATQKPAQAASSLPKTMFNLALLGVGSYGLYRLAAYWNRTKKVSRSRRQPAKQLQPRSTELKNIRKPEQELELLSAISAGDIPTVNRLLAAGVNSNAQPTWRKTTPLMQAVEYQQTEMVALLLEQGADRSLQDVLGLTAYLIALKFDNLEIINLLETQPENSSKELPEGNSEGLLPLLPTWGILKLYLKSPFK